MKRSQVLLLAVALASGGLAAYLVLGNGGSQPPAEARATPQVIAEPKTQILVAARDIGVGERLAADAVQWQDWPEGAVRPEYITIAAAPDAATDIKNAVARFELFAGEPIRDAKLARSDQGYLSAVLSPGMRGVSVTVTPESGSGGFIVPNDHVDVVVTRSGSGGTDISETILSNVKVLAIGKRLGEVGVTGGNPDPNDPTSKTFDAQTVATLELDPAQSETLVNASSGRLSLVLRSVVDFAGTGPEARRNQAVSVIRAGNKASVMAGSSTETVALGAAEDTSSSTSVQ